MIVLLVPEPAARLQGNLQGGEGVTAEGVVAGLVAGDGGLGAAVGAPKHEGVGEFASVTLRGVAQKYGAAPPRAAPEALQCGTGAS